MLDPVTFPRSLAGFSSLREPLAAPGVLGSLTQALPRITAGGAPLVHQRRELRAPSPVEPDRRRAGDFRTHAPAGRE